MAPHLLEEHVLAACEAARRAGAVLEDFRQRFVVQEKGRFDLVTDADLAVQQTVQAFLQERFPDYGFLGEEASGECEPPDKRSRCGGVNVHQGADTPRSKRTCRWIVDPLDGTTNYVHDCPVYAVSIGLEEDGELVAGVIYDPSRQELFHAAKGRGAWLNGRRLQTTSVRLLEQALLSTGFPPDLHGHEHTLATWEYFSLRTQSVRRTGSTALNLAYVAAGRHDGYWTHQAHPWDAAAGIVLIREAGGQVSNLDGTSYDLNTLDLLASNGPLHPVLVESLHAAVRQRDGNG